MGQKSNKRKAHKQSSPMAKVTLPTWPVISKFSFDPTKHGIKENIYDFTWDDVHQQWKFEFIVPNPINHPRVKMPSREDIIKGLKPERELYFLSHAWAENISFDVGTVQPGLRLNVLYDKNFNAVSREFDLVLLENSAAYSFAEGTQILDDTQHQHYHVLRDAAVFEEEFLAAHPNFIRTTQNYRNSIIEEITCFASILANVEAGAFFVQRELSALFVGYARHQHRNEHYSAQGNFCSSMGVKQDSFDSYYAPISRLARDGISLTNVIQAVHYAAGDKKSHFDLRTVTALANYANDCQNNAVNFGYLYQVYNGSLPVEFQTLTEKNILMLFGMLLNETAVNKNIHDAICKYIRNGCTPEFLTTVLIRAPENAARTKLLREAVVSKLRDDPKVATACLALANHCGAAWSFHKWEWNTLDDQKYVRPVFIKAGHKLSFAAKSGHYKEHDTQEKIEAQLALYFWQTEQPFIKLEDADFSCFTLDPREKKNNIAAEQLLNAMPILKDWHVEARETNAKDCVGYAYQLIFTYLPTATYFALNTQPSPTHAKAVNAATIMLKNNLLLQAYFAYFLEHTDEFKHKNEPFSQLKLVCQKFNFDGLTHAMGVMGFQRYDNEPHKNLRILSHQSKVGCNSVSFALHRFYFEDGSNFDINVTTNTLKNNYQVLENKVAHEFNLRMKAKTHITAPGLDLAA